jgi:hypothetical protein
MYNAFPSTKAFPGWTTRIGWNGSAWVDRWGGREKRRKRMLARIKQILQGMGCILKLRGRVERRSVHKKERRATKVRLRVLARGYEHAIQPLFLHGTKLNRSETPSPREVQEGVEEVERAGLRTKVRAKIFSALAYTLWSFALVAVS